MLCDVLRDLIQFVQFKKRVLGLKPVLRVLGLKQFKGYYF